MPAAYRNKANFIAIAFGFCILVAAGDLKADKWHRGNKFGPGRTFTGIAITPAGIGLALENRNFGIAIAPGTLRSFYQGGPDGFGHVDPPFVEPGIRQIRPIEPGIEAVPHHAFRAPVDIHNQPTLASPPVAGPVAQSTSFLPSNSTATSYVQRAEQSFRDRNYDQAIKSIQHALLEDPHNGLLHLFASQIAFASGDYHSAASAALHGTSMVQPSNSFYIVENFREFYSGKEYVRQMEVLERFCQSKPHADYAKSFQAYQYFGLGHQQVAIQMAMEVVANSPDEPLAKWLLSQSTVKNEAIEAPVPPGHSPTYRSVLSE